MHEFFQFNDRGRGPKLSVTYSLDDSGLIVSEEAKGVDYMKTPFDKRFSSAGGVATWKNQAEDEKQTNAKGKLYIKLNGGMEGNAILARALLLSSGGTLPVLPSGAATIRKRQSIPVEASGKKMVATLYEIGGLSYTPNYLWLTAGRQFFALISGWFSVVAEGFETAAPANSPI